ncbi:MAG: PepSY-like domain-containing protein [Parabacteroides sp.]|nr:PepSY-like domain-containing protein [Parabacteroides sp.]
MKTNLVAFAALACSFLAVTGCNDDDSPGYVPDATVTRAFDTKYPNAQAVKWETKASYQVADFRYNNKEAEAWFGPDGTWMMTETDLPSVNDLPVAVQDSFKTSAYAAWRVDDIDQLERAGMEVLYIIEVENGNQETDLRYAASGVLISAVPDTDNDGSYQPVSIPQEITSFIKDKYPKAVIMEVEPEKTGEYEVDILDGNTPKEVRLDKNYKWLQTEWDIPYARLPEAVKTAIVTLYGAYTPDDDADLIETPAGIRYKVELEQGKVEKKVVFDEAGNELSA